MSHPLDFTCAPIPTFLTRLADVVARSNRRDGYYLGRPEAFWVFGKIAYWTEKLDDGSIEIAQATLAKVCSMSRGKVRIYLELFRYYGLIRIVSDYDKKAHRFSKSRITLLPSVREIANGKKKDLVTTVNDCARYGRSSDDGDTLDDSKSWETLPDGSIPLKKQEDMWEATAKRLDTVALQKQQAKRDNFEWLRKSRAFVTGCAKVWQYAQVTIHDNANASMPIWDGDPSKLAKPNRDQYMTLARIFQNEGGYRAAIAWYLYVGGRQVVDQKGRLINDPRSPHIQYATTDKQPASFAKYFDSIINDSAMGEFMESEDINGQLVYVFGKEILDTPARSKKSDPILRTPGARHDAHA